MNLSDILSSLFPADGIPVKQSALGGGILGVSGEQDSASALGFDSIFSDEVQSIGVDVQPVLQNSIDNQSTITTSVTPKAVSVALPESDIPTTLKPLSAEEQSIFADVPNYSTIPQESTELQNVETVYSVGEVTSDLAEFLNIGKQSQPVDLLLPNTTTTAFPADTTDTLALLTQVSSENALYIQAEALTTEVTSDENITEAPVAQSPVVLTDRQNENSSKSNIVVLPTELLTALTKGTLAYGDSIKANINALTNNSIIGEPETALTQAITILQENAQSPAELRIVLQTTNPNEQSVRNTIADVLNTIGIDATYTEVAITPVVHKETNTDIPNTEADSLDNNTTATTFTPALFTVAITIPSIALPENSTSISNEPIVEASNGSTVNDDKSIRKNQVSLKPVSVKSSEQQGDDVSTSVPSVQNETEQVSNDTVEHTAQIDDVKENSIQYTPLGTDELLPELMDTVQNAVKSDNNDVSQHSIAEPNDHVTNSNRVASTENATQSVELEKSGATLKNVQSTESKNKQTEVVEHNQQYIITPLTREKSVDAQLVSNPQQGITTLNALVNVIEKANALGLSVQHVEVKVAAKPTDVNTGILPELQALSENYSNGIQNDVVRKEDNRSAIVEQSTRNSTVSTFSAIESTAVEAGDVVTASMQYSDKSTREQPNSKSTNIPEHSVTPRGSEKPEGVVSLNSAQTKNESDAVLEPVNITSTQQVYKTTANTRSLTNQALPQEQKDDKQPISTIQQVIIEPVIKSDSLLHTQQSEVAPISKNEKIENTVNVSVYRTDDQVITEVNPASITAANTNVDRPVVSVASPLQSENTGSQSKGVYQSSTVRSTNGIESSNVVINISHQLVTVIQATAQPEITENIYDVHQNSAHSVPPQQENPAEHKVRSSVEYITNNTNTPSLVLPQTSDGVSSDSVIQNSTDVVQTATKSTTDDTIPHGGKGEQTMVHNTQEGYAAEERDSTGAHSVKDTTELPYTTIKSKTHDIDKADSNSTTNTTSFAGAIPIEEFVNDATVTGTQDVSDTLLPKVSNTKAKGTTISAESIKPSNASIYTTEQEPNEKNSVNDISHSNHVSVTPDLNSEIAVEKAVLDIPTVNTINTKQTTVLEEATTVPVQEAVHNDDEVSAELNTTISQSTKTPMVENEFFVTNNDKPSTEQITSTPLHDVHQLKEYFATETAATEPTSELVLNATQNHDATPIEKKNSPQVHTQQQAHVVSKTDIKNNPSVLNDELLADNDSPLHSVLSTVDKSSTMNIIEGFQPSIENNINVDSGTNNIEVNAGYPVVESTSPRLSVSAPTSETVVTDQHPVKNNNEDSSLNGNDKKKDIRLQVRDLRSRSELFKTMVKISGFEQQSEQMRAFRQQTSVNNNAGIVAGRTVDTSVAVPTRLDNMLQPTSMDSAFDTTVNQQQPDYTIHQEQVTQQMSAHVSTPNKALHAHHTHNLGNAHDIVDNILSTDSSNSDGESDSSAFTDNENQELFTGQQLNNVVQPSTQHSYSFTMAQATEEHIKASGNTIQNTISAEQQNQSSKAIDGTQYVPLHRIMGFAGDTIKSTPTQSAKESAPLPMFKIPVESFAHTTSIIVRNSPIGESSAVRLVLTPEALGTVVVQMQMNERENLLRIEVESHETRNVIEAQLPALREQFVQNGVRMDSVSVQVKQPEQTSQGTQQQFTGQQQRQEDKEQRAAFLRSFGNSREETTQRERGDANTKQHQRRKQQRLRNNQFEYYA